MSPSEPNQSTLTSFAYSNMAEQQANNVKISFMIMKEVLKKKMNKYLKEINEKKTIKIL